MPTPPSSIHPQTTFRSFNHNIQPQHCFNNNHNFHNAPRNNNQQSANKQNFLSLTLENLECLIEHTTNAEESLHLEGQGGRSKSKTLLTDRMHIGLATVTT
eukprot:4887768-Prymnesium_polylepis.1